MTAPVYDDSNVFAKILRGELPCHKVLETDRVLAFMDIMPVADGHALVIPKAPARGLLDVAPDDLTHVIHAVQTVARAAKAAFDADGITIRQFNEAAGGQEVFHLHFHVLPRHDGVALRKPGGMADGEVLAAHAAKLRAALGDEAAG